MCTHHLGFIAQPYRFFSKFVMPCDIFNATGHEMGNICSLSTLLGASY